MKKVLLLGDSIRLSYQPFVEKELENTIEVHGPQDNCRFAKYTLWYINQWIDEAGKPDIIHWNNGIWDVFHHNDNMGVFTPMEEYMLYIKRVLVELKKTDAEIIWATTTPVKEANVNCNNKEIDKFNEAVLEYFEEKDVSINDLNSVVRKNMEGYIDEDNLHLNAEGQKACAEAVVRAIKKYL